jgi:hypothetical protein
MTNEADLIDSGSAFLLRLAVIRATSDQYFAVAPEEELMPALIATVPQCSDESFARGVMTASAHAFFQSVGAA